MKTHLLRSRARRIPGFCALWGSLALGSAAQADAIKFPFPASLTTRDAATGRIVFASNRDGNNEIYIMDGDGANLQRLTNNPGNDSFPSLSPDGRKLLWASERNGESAAIYEKNLDGSNERRLTNDGATDIVPVYSPDGTRVAYCTNRSGIDYDIWIVDLRDLSHRRLTTNQLGDYVPTWSPDSAKLAFVTYYGNTYVPQITRINADGTGQQQVTNTGPNEGPSWSSANYIAFCSRREGGNQIYVMNADGSNQQPLTSGSDNREPAWDPSSTQIAFISRRDGNAEVYSLNINGNPPVRLTNNAAADITPFWGNAPMPLSGRTLSIEDTQIVEGDSGQVLARFKVKLSAAASVPVSVTFATAGNTAFQGFDFGKVNGTVFFAPGETEQFIDVPVFGDTLTEGSETFKVNLSNPLGATISDGEGVGTIIDNESFPTISIDSSTVDEGNSGTTDAVLTVTLSAASPLETKVEYLTVDSSAIANIDYIPKNGTLIFAPGETQKQISVQVKGDIRYEKDKVFRVLLHSPVYAKLNPLPAGAQVFNPDNHHWYELVTDTATWNDARSAAAARTLYGVAGNLATVTSPTEKSFLDAVYGQSIYYLGGFQAEGAVEPDGGWQWVTGEPFAYTAWEIPEPNNSNPAGNENVIHTFSSPPNDQPGRWNDAIGSYLFNYLVEFDTSSLAALAQQPGFVIIKNDDAGPLPPASVVVLNPGANAVNSLATIDGTASDAVSGGGIAQVNLSLKRLSDNKFWDGFAWSSATAVALPATVSYGTEYNWQYTGDLPSPTAPDDSNKLTNGNYLLIVRARNVDGLTLTVEKSFSVDLGGLVVKVTSPANGAVLK